MSIASLIRKPRSEGIATATVATPATHGQFLRAQPAMDGRTVATVASVAVAKAPDAENADRGYATANGASVASVATVAVADSPLPDTRRIWLITQPNGTRFSLSRNPPCIAADIAADYPGCTITPEADPAPAPPLHPDDLVIAYALLRHWGEGDLTTGNEWLDGLARDPERLEQMRQTAISLGLARYESAPAPVTETADEPPHKAFCARCCHWQADTINPPGGLGRCLIDAPRSRKAGSCWPWTHPGAEIDCNQFKETSPC